MVVDAGTVGGSKIVPKLDLPGERVNRVQPPPRTWKPTGRQEQDPERGSVDAGRSDRRDKESLIKPVPPPIHFLPLPAS